MSGLVVRALLSGLMVAVISFIAKKSPGIGGIIASFPLVSILSMIWIWHDRHDIAAVATFSTSVFWFFVPTMPMFLLIPWMLQRGHGFWMTLGVACALTAMLYLVTAQIVARFGIQL